MGRLIECLRRIFILLYTYLEVVFLACTPCRFRTKKNISGELALITGAGGDIGRELALKLAELGVRLVLWDINETWNNETVRLARLLGTEAHGYVCDVANREDVYATAARVKLEVGFVTILINNAGSAAGKRFLDTPDEVIADVFNVNTMAHFWTCKAFLPDMVKMDYGHIVAIASLSGLVGVCRLTDYTSSKQAVVGFMESLKLELLSEGRVGIKTTVVCPFLTKTGLFVGRYRGVLSRLDPTYVAREIVCAMQLNKEMLILPKLVTAMMFLKPISSNSALLQTNELLSDCDFFNTMRVRGLQH